MNFPPHFTRRELQCRCGCGLCNPRDELLQLAEDVRAALGNTPMDVTSCCRCEAHNKRVGGSPTSKHLTGRALDFVPRSITPGTAFFMIASDWARGELDLLGGLGLYDTFIHIDTARAEDGHLRVWDNRKVKKPEDSTLFLSFVRTLKTMTSPRPQSAINRLAAAVNSWR